MKCYQYTFYISYGQGQGIVFAKNEKMARGLLKSENVYGSSERTKQEIDKIEMVEIDMKKAKLIDFGWSE
jgi:hypothetical protein